MGIVFLLAVIGVALVIDYFAAKEFEYIAHDKGYYEKKYFWWAFLLPAFGMPMVIALPDRVGTKKITDSISKLNVGGSPETPKAQKQVADQLPEL